MIAHETSLLLFNLNSRESEKIVDLEADDRSRAVTMGARIHGVGFGSEPWAKS